MSLGTFNKIFTVCLYMDYNQIHRLACIVCLMVQRGRFGDDTNLFAKGVKVKQYMGIHVLLQLACSFGAILSNF